MAQAQEKEKQAAPQEEKAAAKEEKAVKDEEASGTPAREGQKFSGAPSHSVHMAGGEFVQGPQPKPPASGSKSVVVQSPDDVEEYPEGTHEVAPAEDQFWSAARAEKYNQLSAKEKNAAAGEREL